MFRILLLLLFGLSLGLLLNGGCQPDSPVQSNIPKQPAILEDIAKKPNSPTDKLDLATQQAIKLFDGETLDGWQISNFGGEGECTASAGELKIEMGYPLSGITSVRDDLPTNNYLISLEAKRVEGIDFFCGLTFPVNESHCTFIVGGWAGTVVGLSCIDDKDAARNETRSVMKFERDRWYDIKVRVANENVSCWIDGKQVIDISTVNRKFSVRAETLKTRPLGICTFETTAAFRNIELLRLSPQKGD